MGFLTKSKFKIALECPTKLYYLENEYPSSKVDNPFLQSLANGGFQVGELAKCYHPFGYHVLDREQGAALNRTNELLKKKRVVIYEAAFLYGNLFIRVDILVKNNNNIELIEVKSKTYNSNDENNFSNKVEISSEWKEYLFDVAFQKYVIEHAKKELVVSTFLCLVDKSTSASVNGLNQRFFIDRKGDQVKVKRIGGKLTKEKLGDKLLGKVNVDAFMERLWSGADKFCPETFPKLVERIADLYSNKLKAQPAIKAACGTCEFRIGTEKNGFRECWKIGADFNDDDFAEASILDLWAQNFAGKKDKLIQEGKFFMKDIVRNDIQPLTYKEPDKGLSATDRRMLQVTKSINDERSAYIDKNGLREEMVKWVYPLHFIDFETTAVAIPFNNGRKPYEQIAFQFSHHTVDDKQNVKHHNEWINREVGEFPNFEFVRALRNSLGSTGTIFRYSHHENSILNVIRCQLLESDEADRYELSDWIQTITHSVRDACGIAWKGERDMVDLCELVKLYYYHPLTKGKNSIKAVLEALLETSGYLQAKYSKGVYGTKKMPSRNFSKQRWVVKDKEGKVTNPYQLLPKMFKGIDEKYIMSHTDELKDGGAAMSAYAKMQYTKMLPIEREAITASLLKYCELDTLAMVMIYEEWMREVN